MTADDLLNYAYPCCDREHGDDPCICPDHENSDLHPFGYAIEDTP